MTLTLKCQLCPKGCELAPGDSGNCRVRRNIDDKLVSIVYGYVCTAHIDPVEKKPLFHFLPGTKAFSIATAGCNLHCLNCQNWEISQSNPEDIQSSYCPPEKVVEMAEDGKCASIAYTYNDPVVFYEFAKDCSVKAHEKKIRNILVTAGYINKEPWKKLLEVVDAVTLDIKFINDENYQKVCTATLAPVQETIMATPKAGVHLEISNLVIPTMNDSTEDLRKLSKWIKENVGAQIPLHFLGFYPKYKMKNLPPTPAETLEKARKIAMDEGMQFVYIGNVMSGEGQNTCCPSCKKLLIERSGHSVIQNNVKDGKCSCGKEIYGVWK